MATVARIKMLPPGKEFNEPPESGCFLSLPPQEGLGENSPNQNLRIEPLNLIGTRSTASPSALENQGRGGTRPYQIRKEVNEEEVKYFQFKSLTPALSSLGGREGLVHAARISQASTPILRIIRRTGHYLSSAQKPACSKCRSPVSASVTRSSFITTNEMQSVSDHSLSMRWRNNLMPRLNSSSVGPRMRASGESWSRPNNSRKAGRFSGAESASPTSVSTQAVVTNGTGGRWRRTMKPWSARRPAH